MHRMNRKKVWAAILSKTVCCFCPYTEPRKQLRTDFDTKDGHPRSYRPLHEKTEIVVMGDKTSRIHEESEVKYADGILCCFLWNLSICGALCNQDKFLSTVRLPANICRGRVTFHFELFRVSSMFCTLNFKTQYNIVHLRYPDFCLLTHGVICNILLTSLVWLCFSTWWFWK